MGLLVFGSERPEIFLKARAKEKAKSVFGSCGKSLKAAALSVFVFNGFGFFRYILVTSVEVVSQVRFYR